VTPFILAALTLAAVAALAAGPPGNGPPGLNDAIAAVKAEGDAIADLPGVAAVGAGIGSNGGVVRIYTESAGVRGLPGKLGGVPVQVVVTGKITALHHRPGHGGGPGGGNGDDNEEPPVDPTSRFPRPVPIGVSTGHPDITAGTVGARVTDGTNVYALSNNHVYANENLAAIGDNVLQPGAFDGGTDPADAIGTVDDFEPIVFSTSANNTIDAAIALSSTANLGNSTPSDGYGTPKSTTA
jgi:hypothetical protein